MFKKLKFFISELFLILSVLYYWFLTPNLFNPIAIGLLTILVFQIIKKNATLGIVISATVLLLTLFMVLALISELSEFNTINQNWKNLVIFGSLYLGLNLILAGFMFYKYLKLKAIQN
ncbi:hypothetical protein [Winogradskyella psychrotolerans]|uniref:hypothetical protein n=1 Tax=Winogradskyella psychrotolerans TaxID=1344585 RepID=UPI001C0791F5|nr:hypothetical protein [Winogradskyella psychrotolerans]MBU2929657.1 hypothetical protein [Winogradskyella psychrotolerans]